MRPKMTLIMAVVMMLTTIQPGSGVFSDPELTRLFLRAYGRSFHFTSINLFLPVAGGACGTECAGMIRAVWASGASTVSLQRAKNRAEVAEALIIADGSALNMLTVKDPESIALFTDISRSRLLSRYPWLVVGNPLSITEATSQPNLPIDNQVTFAMPVVNGSDTNKVDLYEVYRVDVNLPYVTRKLGSWQGEASVKPPKEDWIDRRANLTGLHLRCTTMPQPPFMYMTEPDRNMNVQLTGGYALDVWESLREKLKFTYSCKRPQDGQWGTLTSGGSWTGMVGEMVRGQADVVVTSLDHTTPRVKALDFLTGLRRVGYRLVARRPGLMDQTWTSFTSELVPNAWISTIAFAILAPPCLALCAHLSPAETEKVSLKDAYILAIGAFAVQGSWLDVKSLSTRIIFITIFLATLVVYAHYTSALVSLLTVASTTTGFSNLQSLLKLSSYKFGFIAGISIEDEFKNSMNPLFREVWDKMVAPDLESNLVEDDTDGILKVINERYVFMIEESVFSSKFGHVCDAILLRNQYFSSQTGFAFAKDSPLKKIFDTQLMRMRDGGVLSRSWEKWQPPPTLCTAPPVVALNLHHLFTAFLLLLLGVALAIAILPCERLHWNMVGKDKLARNGLVFTPVSRVLKVTSIEGGTAAAATNITHSNRPEFGIGPKASNPSIKNAAYGY